MAQKKRRSGRMPARSASVEHLKRTVPDIKVDPPELLGDWRIPVSVLEAPYGFGEETWLDKSPENLLVWKSAGAEVTVEWGKQRGTRSGRGRVLNLTRRECPNHYLTQSRVRFGVMALPDHLLSAMANDLEIKRGSTDELLRDDLIFFNDDELFRQLSLLADRAADTNEIPTRLEMEARAMVIVNHLLRRYHQVKSNLDLASGGLAPKRLNRVIEYILAHLSSQISLRELSEVAQLSPYHFCRAFKRSTGLSPYAWIANRRVEKAQELMMKYPDMSVAQVALAVGYDRQNSFTTAFKRWIGISPTKWRGVG